MCIVAHRATHALLAPPTITTKWNWNNPWQATRGSSLSKLVLLGRAGKTTVKHSGGRKRWTAIGIEKLLCINIYYNKISKVLISEY